MFLDVVLCLSYMFAFQTVIDCNLRNARAVATIKEK